MATIQGIVERLQADVQILKEENNALKKIICSFENKVQAYISDLGRKSESARRAAKRAEHLSRRLRPSIERELKWMAAQTRNVNFQSLTDQALSAMDRNWLNSAQDPLISSDDESVAKDRRRNRKKVEAVTLLTAAEKDALVTTREERSSLVQTEGEESDEKVDRSQARPTEGEGERKKGCESSRGIKERAAPKALKGTRPDGSGGKERKDKGASSKSKRPDKREDKNHRKDGGGGGSPPQRPKKHSSKGSKRPSSNKYDGAGGKERKKDPAPPTGSKEGDSKKKSHSQKPLDDGRPDVQGAPIPKLTIFTKHFKVKPPDTKEARPTVAHKEPKKRFALLETPRERGEKSKESTPPREEAAGSESEDVLLLYSSSEEELDTPERARDGKSHNEPPPPKERTEAHGDPARNVSPNKEGNAAQQPQEHASGGKDEGEKPGADQSAGGAESKRDDSSLSPAEESGGNEGDAEGERAEECNDPPPTAKREAAHGDTTYSARPKKEGNAAQQPQEHSSGGKDEEEEKSGADQSAGGAEAKRGDFPTPPTRESGAKEGDADGERAEKCQEVPPLAKRAAAQVNPAPRAHPNKVGKKEVGDAAQEAQEHPAGGKEGEEEKKSVGDQSDGVADPKRDDATLPPAEESGANELKAAAERVKGQGDEGEPAVLAHPCASFVDGSCAGGEDGGSEEPSPPGDPLYNSLRGIVPDEWLRKPDPQPRVTDAVLSGQVEELANNPLSDDDLDKMKEMVEEFEKEQKENQESGLGGGSMDEYLPVNAAEEDWNLDLFQGGFPRMDG